MISLSVQALTKTYNRKPIFTDLSFEHSDGILGVSGANGSGKSTLLRCLAYLTRAQKGSFKWIDKEIEIPKDEIKKTIGYAAPYINLYDELTVYENLEFILQTAGLPTQLTHINSQIDQVQMKDHRKKLFKSLSTGQRQRVKIAAALIRKPDVIFLDEPGSNLDKAGHELIKKIVNMQKAKNKLVIIASNDPKEIKLCDQVIKL
ncbi:MAG: ABC transporter ATP-binding protein [bacterium]|jgi:ABC-type multidrug transport system ATPase subunit|nr:ABC transporter ATP-binding protein [bacterium]